ncbi:MAG: hypothetical protein A3E82_00300 [Gammaproteobacteria bacterium RIFCSPHIGHO2_12_FULL_38_11]|nr:MAG: hypothetical protein A3E82_00300 [Gammaproteobacteria bacterium RIFCSPHIGHO2_12_FULL_38_11]
MKKELPIGIPTLGEIVNYNRVYIDKTPFISKLMTGKYYFLSRPRRFGKSLFLDTLKQAFLGNKSLFKGLHLENNWNWDKTYPVIHISFASETHNVNFLEKNMHSILNESIKSFELHTILDEELINTKFKLLIEQLSSKYNQQVVILVDEYDKPILDNLENSDNAAYARSLLKSLYSVIKDSDQYLKFVFLTGVSKFSKAGLFSGLNNLNDITLDAQYADICGYTQADLEREFSDYLIEGKVDKAKLKRWYNGYNFSGSEAQKVYNPFDILLFFNKGFQYRDYWFETGNPQFLIKLIQKNKYYFPNMEGVIIKENMLSSFDLDNISLPVLLFQTGYLTIKSITTLGTQFAYVLGYPNAEVKASLNDKLAAIATTPERKEALLGRLNDCLLSSNMSEIGNIFQSHFASIPHDWYRNNDIQHYEGFYASIIYSCFCALGYTVIAEDNTNTGQMDLAVIVPDKILILEFKLKKNGDAASALQQIKDKKYPDKYVAQGKQIYLLGISFDPEARNVHDFLSEQYNN